MQDFDIIEKIIVGKKERTYNTKDTTFVDFNVFICSGE